MGYMWLVGFDLLNTSLIMMVLSRYTLELFLMVDCYYLRKNSMYLGVIVINI